MKKESKFETQGHKHRMQVGIRHGRERRGKGGGMGRNEELKCCPGRKADCSVN